MPENFETLRALSPKRLGTIPTVLGVLGLSLASQAGSLQINEAKINRANAEMQSGIKSPDTVLQLMAETHRIRIKSHGLCEASMPTGRIISLGKETYKVHLSEKSGDVLEATNGKLFCIGDADNLIKNYNAKPKHKGETK